MSRKAAWLLIGTAVWTVYIWSTRIYTIAKQNQTMSFKVVHSVLAAISIALAVAVGALGVRALRGLRATHPDGGAAENGAETRNVKAKR
ncbi:MAG: hypothetical protein NVSMB57_10010 [Actinomycetota bacterium]